MIKYVLKRVLWVIPVMVVVVVVVYTLTYHIPGSPVVSRNIAEATGLRKPFIVQLSTYLWNLCTKFDLGMSYLTTYSVTAELITRVPITLTISMLSILLTLIIGIPLGIQSSLNQNSVLDISLTSLSLISSAIPSYVLALVGALVFGVYLQWLPVARLDSWSSWILPVICSSGIGIAVCTRMTRTAMLEVIRQDYIRMARAKGLTENKIVFRHAFTNCLITLSTAIGSQIAVIFTSTIIIETIFAIPGMGYYLFDGINQRDYPVINGVVVVISFLVCLINLLIDITYAFIDPRIRTLYASHKKQGEKEIT